MQTTVLVVDDDDSILDLLVSILRSDGYTVITADTPILAISIVDDYNGELDLFLSDVRMPKMTGPELALEIQKKFKNIKCVFMSGVPIDMNSDIVEKDAYYIQKPFMRAELLALLKSIFTK